MKSLFEWQEEDELKKFMETDEWLTILGVLSLARERLCVHSFDDTCDMHAAIYLNGRGFIDEQGKKVRDLKEIFDGFQAGYVYMASERTSDLRERSQLIPWIRNEVAGIKKTLQQRSKKRCGRKES